MLGRGYVGRLIYGARVSLIVALLGVRVEYHWGPGIVEAIGRGMNSIISKCRRDVRFSNDP
jgi:ABC-type dipeptide/oligopeptide/nickel transport system permease subunit